MRRYKAGLIFIHVFVSLSLVSITVATEILKTWVRGKGGLQEDFLKNLSFDNFQLSFDAFEFLASKKSLVHT